MKITKARLKQIIQEELQTLSEQTTAASTARKRAASYTGGSGETIDQEMARRKKQGDLRQVDPETGKIAYQTTDTAMAAQDATSDYGMPGQSSFDPESEYNKQRDADVAAQVASGGIEFDDSIRPGGDTDSTVTSSTVVDDILSGKPEGAEGAFGDADGKEKPAKPARVASKGKGATRREINKMWKAGEFGPYKGGKKGTKSYAKWVKLRRTLANKGEAAARAALGGASAPEQQRDVAKKRQRKAALGGEGGYADAAEKAAEPAVAAPEAPKVNRNIAKIDQYTKAFGELTRGDMPSNRGVRKKLLDLVSNFEQQGLPRDEAVETASGVLGSRLQNRIKRLKLQPDVEKMLAARKRRAGEARGRELAATARDRGAETPSMALGRGVPGALEESVEKLTNLIAEEFKEALSENEDEKTALEKAEEKVRKAQEKHDAAKKKGGPAVSLTKQNLRRAELERDKLRRAAGGGTGKPGGK
jgi:hypothetical protein